MNKNKRILVCPLDWGLGHATRMIPLIQILLKNNFVVIIAADKQPLKLLKDTFPDLELIIFHSYSIRYSKKGFSFFKFIIQIPKIIISTINEHFKLKKIISIHSIDCVLSDNRYGVYNKNIPSVFITHQIRPKLPKIISFLEFIPAFFIKKIIQNYDLCLIPDFKNSLNLSGELSHKGNLPKNIEYIGCISRFVRSLKKENTEQYFLTVVLSGPEPQRTILENIITKQSIDFEKKTLIVRGKPEIFNTNTINNVTFVNHLSIENLQMVLQNSNFIICRAGYTSIMDLITLKKTAILIPTPGQTEQEYLGEILSENKLFLTFKQQKFDLVTAIDEITKFNFKTIDYEFNEIRFVEIIKSLFKN